MTVFSSFYSNVNLNKEPIASGKRPHCVASMSLMDNGEFFANLVIDWYSPKGQTPGFYAAFRAPGYTERAHPKLRIFLGDSLAHIKHDFQLMSLMEDIAELWGDVFDPEATTLAFVNDPRFNLY